MRKIAWVTLLAVFATGATSANAGLLQEAAPAVAPFQIVSGDTAAVFAAPGAGVSFNVQYDVSDADNTLSGLGVRLHYDSSFLTLTSPTAIGDLFPSAAFQYQETADVGDLDGDASTDRYVLTAWVDFLGNWPSVALPIDLYNAAFTLGAGVTPGASTTIRFTESSTAGSHTFQSENVVVTAIDVPEPTTFALFLATAVCALGYGHRRNQKRHSA